MKHIDQNKRLFILEFLAIAAFVIGAVFFWPLQAHAQQAQCGFTATNDYVCPGAVNGPPPKIQPLPDFSAPEGSGTLPGTYNKGGGASTGSDYQAALQKLESQLAKDQQALEDFMADPTAYDDGSGHAVGDISPIPLTAAQCNHDSTERLPNGKLPVIPGAAGFGMDTPGGRGGKIIKVTNLDAYGSGSLRACIEASGPRTCVFEVSGTIKLTTDLRVKNPYLTIAGQTAPSPGITVRGAALRIQTHDVLVQHIRLRVGDDPEGPDPGNRDGLQVGSNGGDVHHVVIDHVSASWSTDSNVGTWYDVQDITFNNSIISENLMPHSLGFLIGDNAKRVSAIGNLMAHNKGRNPGIKGGSSSAIINNLMYNAGSWAFAYTADDYNNGPVQTSFVGNVFKEGPSSDSTHGLVHRVEGSKLYMSDNAYDGTGSLLSNRTSDSLASSPPVWPPGYSPVASSDTQAYVLSNAGARPADRDNVDNRVINDVINGTGSLIESQNEVGGWPSLAKNYRVFDVPANPNGDDDGDGYTNLEEVLHQYAAQVEGCG